jgi:hypothetical protein
MLDCILIEKNNLYESLLNKLDCFIESFEVFNFLILEEKVVPNKSTFHQNIFQKISDKLFNSISENLYSPEIKQETKQLIKKYLTEISKSTKISTPNMVSAVILYERLLKTGFKPTLLNIVKAFSVSVFLSIKMNDDRMLENSDLLEMTKGYFKSLKELKKWEVCFLKSVGYQLYISKIEYQSYLKNMNID